MSGGRYSILKKLSEYSVVYFELNKDKTSINVMDGCDLYFKVDLSKLEVGYLIDELTVFYNEMK
jgi:hypothetical protein